MLLAAPATSFQKAVFLSRSARVSFAISRMGTGTARTKGPLARARGRGGWKERDWDVMVSPAEEPGAVGGGGRGRRPLRKIWRVCIWPGGRRRLQKEEEEEHTNPKLTGALSHGLDSPRGNGKRPPPTRGTPASLWLGRTGAGFRWLTTWLQGLLVTRCVSTPAGLCVGPGGRARRFG